MKDSILNLKMKHLVCKYSSIPNGENHFKDIVDSNSGLFKKFYIKWSDIPSRDDSWVDDKIKMLGVYGFAQYCDNIFYNKKQWNRNNNLSILLDNPND